MTQEPNERNALVPVPRADILEASQSILSKDELEVVIHYINSGGHDLSSDTVDKFFELFLNGSDCREIHRLNKPFPYPAILIARVKYHWDNMRDQYILNKQVQIRDKVMRAQLEATELVADMLVAARKKHGDRLKKYIQTGDDKDLAGAMNIDSLGSLLKTVEGLLKITGQDRQTTNKNINRTESTTNINVNAKVSGTESNLDSADAAAILSIIANSKRKVPSK